MIFEDSQREKFIVELNKSYNLIETQIADFETENEIIYLRDHNEYFFAVQEAVAAKQVTNKKVLIILIGREEAHLAAQMFCSEHEIELSSYKYLD